MVEAKTIGIGALVALLSGLVVLGGISIYDKNVYYCEASKVVMQCDKLTAYYGLDNGKCVNAKVGNKLCRTGWLEVSNDIIVGSEVSAKQYVCDFEGCVPK